MELASTLVMILGYDKSMKPLLKALAIFWISFGSLGCLFYLAYASGFFNVSTIEVTPLASRDITGKIGNAAGNDNNKEELEVLRPQIEKILSVYKGLPIWKASVDSLYEEVKKIPGVKEVEVDRLPPSTLRIQVSTKKIAMVFLSEDGKVLPVTDDSEVLPLRNVVQIPDAPVVRNAKLIRIPKNRDRLVKLISQLPENGRLSRARLSEITMDERDGFWLSLIQDSVKIKMGDENVGIKSARVEKVLEYLQTNKLQARVIDAEYSKKVVVKLRKGR